MLKYTRPVAALAVCLCLAAPARAAITGQVVDDVTGDPIAGARVRIQATTDEPAITDANGQFELVNLGPDNGGWVTAVLTYSSENSVNYIVGQYPNYVGDGTDIEIRLTPLPDHDASDYSHHDTFPPGQCGGCHFNQHQQWSESHHSDTAQNFWVLDMFDEFRDTHDDDDTGFCAACHAPLEDRLAMEHNPMGAFLDEVSEGSHGVSCLACHQMAEVDPDAVEKLHHHGNTQYYFPDGPSRQMWVWGPLDDVADTMRASFQPQFSQAVFCASCHEYENPRNPGIPGQTTYTEWLASPFGPEGENRPCQSCHMPPADGPGSIGGSPIRPAEQRRNHSTIGATPATLENAIALEVEATQQGSRLVVNTEVENHGAGHAFPTGISIRNAILHIRAEYDGAPLAQVAGPVIPFYGSASDGIDPEKDLAGLPGKGFARVLEGEVGGERKYPVLFIDADTVRSETRIPAGEIDESAYYFDLSPVPEGATINVHARLLYRRAWRDLEVRMGWTETPSGGDIEILVDSESLSWTVQEFPPDEVFRDRFEQ